MYFMRQGAHSLFIRLSLDCVIEDSIEEGRI
jgi:hypothetical protein